MVKNDVAVLRVAKNALAISANEGLTAGFVGTLVIKVGTALLALLVSIVLARGLGAKGYGIYSLALSVMTLLSIPVLLGLPTLLIREVARYHVGKQWSLMRGILRRADEVVVVLSMAIVLISGATIWIMAGSVDATQLATIAWALPLLPLMALSSLRGAVLQGWRRVLQAQVPDMLVRPGLMLVFAGLALFIGGITPQKAMVLYTVAAALALSLGAVLRRRARPPELRTAVASYETAAWARSVVPLALLSGFLVVIAQTDVAMLGLLATNEEVGLYRVAVSAAALVVFALSAVNLVVSPVIARLYRSDERARLQEVVTLSARLALAVALPVALVFVVFGAPIVAFAFGESFRTAHIALAILCVGQIVNAAVGSVGVILNMTGHERDTMNAVAIAAVVNVLLNLVLIPQYGIEGAAAASSATLVLWNAILCRMVRVRLGLRSHAF